MSGKNRLRLRLRLRQGQKHSVKTGSLCLNLNLNLFQRFRGYTLIEILIAMAIVGLLLSVALPVSYSMYKGYKDSLEAEKVLMLLSDIRREAFLHSRVAVVDAVEGTLTVDGARREEFGGIFIRTEKAIQFYKNGTTSGGTLILATPDNAFTITVEPPIGEIKLSRGEGGG